MMAAVRKNQMQCTYNRTSDLVIAIAQPSQYLLHASYCRGTPDISCGIEECRQHAVLKCLTSIPHIAPCVKNRYASVCVCWVGGRVGGETNSCEHIVATEMKISKSTLPPQCCEVWD